MRFGGRVGGKLEDNLKSTSSIRRRIIWPLVGLLGAYLSIRRNYYDVFNYFLGGAFFLQSLSIGFPRLIDNLYCNLLVLSLIAFMLFFASTELSWPCSSLLILGYLALAYYLLWYKRNKVSESIKSGDKS